MECLSDVAELEAVVGGQPLGSMLKSITEFDDHCRAIIAVARAAVVGAPGADGGLRSELIGGDAGFASVAGPTVLALEGGAGVEVEPGTPVGLVLLVPGLGETLRVNGRLRADGGVDAEEIYLHCAKAIIRSKFWKGGVGDGEPVAVDGDGPLADPEVLDILGRSPFAVITSHDGDGNADASPKGDPAGFVRALDASTIALPDRPGNHRTDTWHNIVVQPDVGVVLMVPGDDRVLELRGRAGLTTDDGVRIPMTMRDKTPKVALVVDVDHAEVRHSPVPAAAGLWDQTRNVDTSTLPRMAKVFTDHVKQNRTKGVAAAAARKLVNAKVLEKGLEHDYAKNLY